MRVLKSVVYSLVMKRLLLVIGLFLLLATASVAHAQSAAAWTGSYFANRNLQGNPVLTRDDPAIDFVWGNHSPDSTMPVNDFSVRWTRWLFVDTPGNWTFTAINNDGVRLFVDDALVIDAWNDQPLTVRSVTLNLSPSFHRVRMEYYKHSGSAEARLQLTSPNFPDWRGDYFSNPDLTGAPAFSRNDASINFDFGTAGPGGGVAGTNFSARWTRRQYFSASRYRFTTTTDDGVRLWVDGQLVIDQWHDQTPTSWRVDLSLADGNHWLEMDYYQHGASAQAQLTWVPVTGSIDLWRGEYFSNPSLDGTATFTRDDAAVNFDWGASSPGRGIASTNWSARWTSRRATNAPGFYTVIATADDGVRVWVDNNLLIDQWHDQSPTVYAAMVYLSASPHDWRIEFYQHLGAASLHVDITSGASDPAPLTQPTAGDVIIDPQNIGFLKSGTAWQAGPNNSEGSAFSAPNTTYAHDDSNWARWYPPLDHAGNYEVSVYIPGTLGTTRSARYGITHSGSSDFCVINQSLYSNQWVSLGKYYFSALGDEYVYISDVTYESPASTILVAAAVKFSPR